jgi:hypothetical protein
MPHQQQQELTFKDKFNFAHSLCVYHQRCLVIDRTHWGTEALGKPCAFAAGLMLIWYLVTADAGMLLWMGWWFLVFIKRRIEAVKLVGQVHSWYDGYPHSSMKFTKSEDTAKRVVEPVMVGIAGLIALWFYREMGWRCTGLPAFLLAGFFTLPFVEWVKHSVLKRQLQGMFDARVEHSVLQRNYKNRFGG